jgi:Zn-dependent M28 family amino/carboxypeptidase
MPPLEELDMNLRAVCFPLLLTTLACSRTPAVAPATDPMAETARQLAAAATAETAARQAAELVRSLTVVAGPRLAGSPGDARAVAWAEAKLRELGFENVRAEPVTVPHWERGIERAEIVAPHAQPLHVTALGGSVATPPEGLVAPVLRVGSLDELIALPDGAASGRIVFIDRPMERARDGSGYGPVVAGRGRGAAEGARKGAVAVLIRSAATGTHRFPHTGGMRYDDTVAKIPAGALAVPDADLLAAQLELGGPVTLRLTLETRTLPDAPSANVIGEIRGREQPDEIVLLGAHLDSWDLGTGALDDGAGVAIVISAARRIAALPERPRRTIRVVLFANEEFGLSGGRAYAADHAAELDRHVLATEADFGDGKVWRFSSAVAPEALPRMERLAALLAPLGIEHAGNTANGGADLSPLAAGRVPLADLFQDGSTYFDYHHTADDTFDKIDPESLAQNVAAYAITAWFAAEDEEGFGRAPAP